MTVSWNNVFSQSETDTLKQGQIVIIKMENGDEYQGTISKLDNETIVLKMSNGEISLVAANVRSIENYDYEGKFKFPNPHETRYFFGPSGIPIKKEKGYYQNVLVTTNFVNYGITEHFSIGGGFEFLSTVNGTPLWFFTPKVGFEVAEDIHVGGGLLMLGLASEGTWTLAYGVTTFGDSENNLSIGVGYGRVDGEFSDSPAIMLSGTTRVSNSISILSENYIIPTSLTDVTFFGVQGIRILSKKNAFDIGALFFSGGGLRPVPFVGYARAF